MPLFQTLRRRIRNSKETKLNEKTERAACFGPFFIIYKAFRGRKKQKSGINSTNFLNAAELKDFKAVL